MVAEVFYKYLHNSKTNAIIAINRRKMRNNYTFPHLIMYYVAKDFAALTKISTFD